MNTELIKHLSKEAGALRMHMEKGKIDINETLQFLARVENVSSPRARRKKVHRFDRQMLKV